MSAVTLATAGYPRMLFALLDGAVWFAHLYVNDPPITPTVTKDDFVELVADGYAPIALDRWTPPILRTSYATSFSDPLLWVIAPDPVPPAVQGYYVTDQRDGPLLWAWRRPGPPFQSVPGASLLIVFVEVQFPPRPA